jgi:hypothetical protein
LTWSWLSGRLNNALRSVPRNAHPFEVMLVARKPE